MSPEDCAGKARFDDVVLACKASQRSSGIHHDAIRPYRCTAKKSDKHYGNFLRLARRGNGGSARHE